MEKIYSRRKIKLPKLKFSKFSKISRIKLLLTLLLFVIVILIIIFFLGAYPIFEATCKNRAGSIAINITTSEVNKVMSDYEYEDLMQVEKNENGEVTMLTAKIVPINEMISKITSNIKNKIDNTPQTVVEIDMGAVSGVSVFSLIGPKFNIKLECSGDVDAILLSEISSVGINQSLHRIYLDLTTNVSILTPFNSIKDEYKSKVLLAEAMIVGDIPETYYYYDDILQDDILDTN